MDFRVREALWVVVTVAALAVVAGAPLARGGEPALLTPDHLDALVPRDATSSVASDHAGDDAFLRRVSFDLIGRPPTLEEFAQFAADSAPNKRHEAIERLLSRPEFGVNWANYWRDTIAFRIPPPELTYLNYGPLSDWLARQFNENVPWDQVARELLTAVGKIEERPAATFVGYHQGEPTNLAGETSRIFLGQQIHCAQCHDHPFDHWKRSEFHGLAAFFARTKVKLSQNDGIGTVVSSAPKGEYVMPDMDPSKKGRSLEPTFLDGGAAAKNLSDEERRARLAELVTSNRWFALAFTNRLAAQLLGQGFYETVDDLGAERPRRQPAVHDALAGHFVANGFRVKELFRLLMNSQFYQDAQPPETTPRQRLRGDELFAALAIGMELPNVTPPRVAPTAAVRFPPPPKSTRDLIFAEFGADPSLSATETPRTMGQALLLMNNEQLQKQLRAAPGSGTMLSRLLDEQPDDAHAYRYLVQRMLARPATTDEVQIATAHVAKLGERRAAFEDLLWCLVNSAEFSLRH